MDGFSWSLVVAAAGIALTHTILGPDHYVPFAMLARARRWSLTRTSTVTVLCGLGHVLSSLALGGLGLALGVAVGRLEQVEGVRGSLAAWALVAFGLAYGVWGTRRALRRSRGLEAHAHADHVHVHAHGHEPHAHERNREGSRLTFWTLFAVFVLGPCEPLIPLFMLPASRGRWGVAAATAIVFGVVTLATMVGLTLLQIAGMERLGLGRFERWSHSMAGGVIAASGLAIIFWGL